MNDAITKPFPVKLFNDKSDNAFVSVNPDGEFQGYVGVAFQNAFYQLLHVTPENGGFYKVIKDTISLGGDTDTNACIAGALCGACHGYKDIPNEWKSRKICQHNGTKLCSSRT